MSTGTGIEWTDSTWSPITGCTRVSAGCDNCYSARMTYRLEKMGQRKYTGLTVVNPRGDRHFNGVVKCHDDQLDIPLKWKKPRKIFVNSMSDTFHKDVPFEFIDKMFAVMAICPQHTFQVLTKRPERMAEYMSGRHDGAPRWACVAYQVSKMTITLDGRNPSGKYLNESGWPLPNVWLGTSVENQQAADERIPHLLRCPAAVRFLSVEPLLGATTLAGLGCPYCHGPEADYHTSCDDGISWVIVGGESGPGARPTIIGHIREVVNQCTAAEVAVFVKQLGAHPVNREGEPHKIGDGKGGNIDEFPEDLRVRQFPANDGIRVRPRSGARGLR